MKKRKTYSPGFKTKVVLEVLQERETVGNRSEVRDPRVGYPPGRVNFYPTLVQF